jgi:Protein of unknown function (DUF2877)
VKNARTPLGNPTSGALTAAAVATPVYARLVPGSEGVVLGTASRSAWLEVEDFVVAVMPGSLPLMPNGVAVARGQETTGIRRGAPVRVGTEWMEAGDVTVDLAGARLWSPLAPFNEHYGPRDVWVRARQLLAGMPPPEPSALVAHLGASTRVVKGGRGEEGVRKLLRAAEQRDAGLASEAADLLVGRGTGLTPEGDDLLAAAAAAAGGFGRAVGFDEPARRTWAGALFPAGAQERTTALSSTLLRLAVEGMVLEPVRNVLDLSRSPEHCRADTARLWSIGHGTGRAYALGLGSVAALLAR